MCVCVKINRASELYYLVLERERDCRVLSISHPWHIKPPVELESHFFFSTPLQSPQNDNKMNNGQIFDQCSQTEEARETPPKPNAPSQRVQLAYQSPLTVYVLKIDRAVGCTAYSGLARNSNLRHTFCSFSANFHITTAKFDENVKVLTFSNARLNNSI
jgi:hypothetical protein